MGEPLGEDPSSARSLHLNGAVQKGPFIVGSSIRVATLDADTNPTGLIFTTSTRDDRGQFELEVPAADLVAIEGTGFYYNEVTGSLSESALTLRALYDVGSGRADAAFVNAITHLSYERVQRLIVGGLTYDDARAQAEQELVTGLGITPSSFAVGSAGTQLNVLGGDTNDNAYLLAVSTVLAQAAELASPDAADAALQELLNRLALDLADTGSIDAGRRTQLITALAAIDASDVELSFVARYPTASVPDLDRILDQDGDGLVNIADDCPTLANPLQEDIDLDGTGDVCDSDRDGDGTPDASDSLPSDPSEWTDADGVNDGVDNCLSLDNPDQADTDADQVGDACDPDAPTCNFQTLGQQQCNEQNVEVCSFGLWTTTQSCDFWCRAGACIACKPGATFCDIPGGSTHVTVWVCDASATLRRFVSASASQTCLPPDFPADTSSLPIDTNPPRWVRVVGSR